MISATRPPPGSSNRTIRGGSRITIGSRNGMTGLSLVYKTKDFVEYELLDGVLHAVPGTGMWECVDFYPVSTTGNGGLDMSANGPVVKHVLKVSLDNYMSDYYAIADANTWTPDDPVADAGIVARVDYGKYYASKSFFDQNKGRRVLWAWIGETDSERLRKGWASVQTIPRVVTFDEKTKINLLQWPVEEVEALRMDAKDFSHVKVNRGSVVPLDVGTATQLDIEAEFVIEAAALEGSVEADVGYNCSTSVGAAGRSALGPFGLLVLANEDLLEQTAVYFYIGRAIDGSLKTYLCQDELRSSKENDLGKRVYGSMVPVLHGEKLSVRILVDHSVVESFGQGGRTCITSRVYPTKAIYGAARVFLLNNATEAVVTATSVRVWGMNAASVLTMLR